METNLKINHHRVLVFPAGTEIGLEIHRALCGCKDITLIGAGEDESHAPFVYLNHHVVPRIHSPNWFEALKSLVKKEQITCIIPAHDEAVTILSSRADELGVPIITSPASTCEIARSKSQTYEKLNGIVPTPKLYSFTEEIPYPVFLKPDRGQGSVGTKKINSREEMLSQTRDGNLLVEYLPGEEFTIDCFSDRELGLLFSGGRVRKRIRNGISVRTTPVDRPEFHTYAKAIASQIPFWGAWFFQLKENKDGKLVLLEIAPRIAGAMACYRTHGINFAYLSILEAYRRPFKIHAHSTSPSFILDRALTNRYFNDITYKAVYLDFDDTVFLNGFLYGPMIQFIFQCINKKIPITLLTRHKTDINKTLKELRLTNVFDKVVHITDGALKSNFITEKNSIFIDDSFSERVEVSSRLNIPTYDLSMVEALLDDRR